jgi:hypothetical protein
MTSWLGRSEGVQMGAPFLGMEHRGLARLHVVPRAAQSEWQLTDDKPIE